MSDKIENVFKVGAVFRSGNIYGFRYWVLDRVTEKKMGFFSELGWAPSGEEWHMVRNGETIKRSVKNNFVMADKCHSMGTYGTEHIIVDQ